MNEATDRETGRGIVGWGGVVERERGGHRRSNFSPKTQCFKESKFTGVMHRNLRRCLEAGGVKPACSYLVNRGRLHNCGGRVSLAHSAMRGFVNLDVVSVPSTPQSEVLNPRFSEYPPRWPVFHRAEAAFMGLTRKLTCRLHTARLLFILSGLSTIDQATRTLCCTVWQGTIMSSQCVEDNDCEKVRRIIRLVSLPSVKHLNANVV